MKKIIFFLLILPVFVNAQVKQKPISYGVEYARVGGDSAVRIPTVQVGYKDFRAGFDTAQLWYKKADSSIQVWTGSQWIGIGGSGSGTVTSISQGYGIINTPNPIVSTGSVAVDSATLANYFLRRKDSAFAFSNPALGYLTGYSGIVNQDLAEQNASFWVNHGVMQTLYIKGSGSGTISILPQTAAGTYNFNLPITAGNSGEYLTSAGGVGSPMTWTAGSSIVSNEWHLTGNSGTTAGTNFLGTTDAQPLYFNTNGSNWMDLTTGGRLGMGLTSGIIGKLHIKTDNIQTTQTDSTGIYLENSTVSTSGVPLQNSPAIVFKGTAKQSIGGSSQNQFYRISVIPSAGSFGTGANFDISAKVGSASSYYQALKLSVPSVGQSLFQILNSDGRNGRVQNLYFETNSFGYTITPVQITTATTAQNNIGFGTVFNHIISASNNVAMGTNALAADTSGSNNTAIGYAALATNLSADDNTAIGTNALPVSTSGFKNTAIGAGSLENLLSGYENTFVGEDAGLRLTTGIENVGVGWLGGAQDTTGNYNVSIGTSTGRSVGIGNKNTFLGHQAGYGGSQANNVSYTIGLGADAHTTASNQLAVSDSILRFTFPGVSRGVANYVLTDSTGDGQYWVARPGGGGSGLTVGTTTISNSATRRVLYDSAGVLSDNGLFQYNAGGELQIGSATDLGAYNLQVTGASYFSDNSNYASSRGPQWNGGNQFVYADGSGDLYGSATGHVYLRSGGVFCNFEGGKLNLGSSATPDSTLTVLGSARISGNVKTSGTFQMSAFGAGAATFDASGNISSVSDERLKFVKGSYTAGLKELMRISPITFKWRPESGNETEHEYAGFSAQNVKSVLGDLGSGQNGKGYLSIQDRAIAAMTVNSVQELERHIEQQDRVIAELVKEIKKLKRE